MNKFMRWYITIMISIMSLTCLGVAVYQCIMFPWPTTVVWIICSPIFYYLFNLNVKLYKDL